MMCQTPRSAAASPASTRGRSWPCASRSCWAGSRHWSRSSCARRSAPLVLLPWLSGSSSAPLDDIVPSNAKAVVAQQRALELFGATVSTDALLVDRNPRGLTRPLVEAHARQALAVSRDEGPTQLRGVRTALP